MPSTILPPMATAFRSRSPSLAPTSSASWLPRGWERSRGTATRVRSRSPSRTALASRARA
eukprot:10804057-Alexandrium_andersonii.AAC.1